MGCRPRTAHRNNLSSFAKLTNFSSWTLDIHYIHEMNASFISSSLRDDLMKWVECPSVHSSIRPSVRLLTILFFLSPPLFLCFYNSEKYLLFSDQILEANDLVVKVVERYKSIFGEAGGEKNESSDRSGDTGRYRHIVCNKHRITRTVITRIIA